MVSQPASAETEKSDDDDHEACNRHRYAVTGKVICGSIAVKATDTRSEVDQHTQGKEP